MTYLRNANKGPYIYSNEPKSWKPYNLDGSPWLDPLTVSG